MGTVEITRRNGCAILTLCNEPRRNALNHVMLASLREALTALADDASCRAVAIEGQGAHFCAGRDITELSSAEALSDDDLRADFDKLRALFTALHAFPKPLIAIVRGYALGLGAALVCFSDIVLADTTARLGIPEVKVGVAPSITTVALMRVSPREPLRASCSQGPSSTHRRRSVSASCRRLRSRTHSLRPSTSCSRTCRPRARLLSTSANV